MQRYLEPQIRADLKRKRVFVGGPRQVGKTTLARAILGKSQTGVEQPGREPGPARADDDFVTREGIRVAPALELLKTLV